jgi:lipopolysaccharide export system protein LptA
MLFSVNRLRSLLPALLCLAIFYPRVGHGLSGDTEQPIQVEADSAEYDDKTGTSVYRGKVRMIQGSMVLTGDVVTVLTPGQRLTKIIADGHKATFKMLRDDGETVYAEAEHLEYDISDHKILLLRKASVEQGNNRISSERIEYDTATQTVEAGHLKDGGRVKMTIIPGTTPSNP